MNNAVREVGGALGVALLASVFAAHGGYQTPTAFTDGLTPALWVGVACLLGGAIAAAACRPSANRAQARLDSESASPARPRHVRQ